MGSEWQGPTDDSGPQEGYGMLWGFFEQNRGVTRLSISQGLSGCYEGNKGRSWEPSEEAAIAVQAEVVAARLESRWGEVIRLQIAISGRADSVLLAQTQR